MNYVTCLTHCIYLVTDYTHRLQVQKSTVLCATAAGYVPVPTFVSLI